MKHMTKRALLAILACAALAPVLGIDPLSAQDRSGSVHPWPLQRGGVDQVSRAGRFSLAIGAGAAGADGVDDPGAALAVTPYIRLAERARFTLSLALPVISVPDSATERGLRRLDDAPPVNSDTVETGASTMVTPSLELRFRPGCCLRPSVFVGTGVRRDRGPTLSDDLEADATTSPVITVGAAVECPVTRQVAMRFDVRTVTTFYDETEIRGPNGRLLGMLEADTVTTVVVTMGTRVLF